MMSISVRYIKELRFPNHTLPVRFVVIGREEGCYRFQKHVELRKKVKIITYITDNHYEYAYELYKNNKADGILLLDHPRKKEIVQFLKDNGMKYNHNYFRLHSGNF
ncbi:thioredoxin domain-containing protein [Paenibacillus hexagrammi]|uniref:Uncharacterized protein n=1 Tax=Paenibacillus hexagrammi TaxID=2908839 RepID=A0ABY3SE88_9BACL|nr:hypothetical protein [Paenibacillus sp. YPD9-1]UJF31539.1 hypothetical protein L0M14_17180 [Paenibacillus sp. YPD9-1]